MIFVLLVLIVLAVTFIGTASIVGISKDRLDSNRRSRIASDKALGAVEASLRRIQNGAIRPDLEASIALDEITKYRDKELN